MTLPPLLVLTDRRQARRPLLDTVRAAVDGGARAVVLREKDLPRDERLRLADALRPLLGAVSGLLVVASDAAIPSDGVHLSGADPLPARRPPLVGRSCHHPSDLDAAATEGADWATLSPIFPSPSKPGYGPALGPAALRDAPLPVFALGGVDAARAEACMAAGAAGVAAMGAVMTAEDPAAAVAALLRRIGREVTR